MKILIAERPYTGIFSTYLYNRQLTVKYNLQESSWRPTRKWSYTTFVTQNKTDVYSTWSLRDQNSFTFFFGSFRICANATFKQRYQVLHGTGYLMSAPTELNCIYWLQSYYGLLCNQESRSGGIWGVISLGYEHKCISFWDQSQTPSVMRVNLKASLGVSYVRTPCGITVRDSVFLHFKRAIKKE